MSLLTSKQVIGGVSWVRLDGVNYEVGDKDVTYDPQSYKTTTDEATGLYSVSKKATTVKLTIMRKRGFDVAKLMLAGDIEIMTQGYDGHTYVARGMHYSGGTSEININGMDFSAEFTGPPGAIEII